MVATGDCNREGPFAAFLTFDVAQVPLGHGGRNVPRAGHRDRFLAVEMLDYVPKTVGADNSPSETAFSHASCEMIPMAANSAKAIDIEANALRT